MGFNTYLQNYIKKEMDPVVQTVIESFQKRSELGQKKYGITLEENNLPFLAWVQHMQEELMDAILYLEKLKKTHENGFLDVHMNE
jgi:hypothetical protein